MEPEEELRRRPPTSDERLLKGGSDLWLPLPPEEMPPNDFTAVTEIGEGRILYVVLDFFVEEIGYQAVENMHREIR